MGWTNQTHDSFYHHSLDLCCVHYHFVCPVDISMDDCDPRPSLEKYRAELPELPCHARPEYSPRRWMETVFGLRRVDEE